MHLQVAVFFLGSEGRAVPRQHKSFPMGFLFLETMTEEEKEGARSSSFLLLVIVFGFLFVVMSHLQGVLISTWSRSGQHSTRCGCAAGILWPSPRWGWGSSSSRATWSLGEHGVQGQPGELKSPRESCSSILTSRSCRTITQKGSETCWTWFGTQRKGMKTQRIFKNKLFHGSEPLSYFCLSEPLPAEDPRGSPISQGLLSVSSLPSGGAGQCNKCNLCTSQQLAMHTR